ncbi:ADP-ribosylglycohydrolase family protein [Mastigocoleus sp. MO_188.B34]|uniref:ADP-ribosylglycohydrolase family protein n=1 Tax=Mastigocoleus sp. MO_188.B34 TaxID=3036635 RepID=UPI0026316907|nr:ADP-ribosylglycohydrolase family protein [Mastigocoleus sp. MO_188.B34]MDJ0692821.1 ADP-ribosylglycohydrolase family protein [Mastigocoleus sp. MO_188.B34]
MRYPLTNRFRGALLGVLIGENLALSDTTQKTGWNIWWYEIIVSSIQSLIELGKFDVEHWSDRVAKKWHSCEPGNSILNAAIIATLPVTFFFHENKLNLRDRLLEALSIWENYPGVKDAALAVNYAVAQSFNEKLSWETLVPQIVDFIGGTSTELPQKLLQIDNSIVDIALLQNLEAESDEELKSITAVRLGFYYFINSPEDFRLSILRASRNPYCGVEVISGILSGSYNGTLGIPVNWQIGQSNLNIPSSRLTSCFQMLELADALIAVWSGVYELGLHSSTLEKKLAIAAPSVIQCS